MSDLDHSSKRPINPRRFAGAGPAAFTRACLTYGEGLTWFQRLGVLLLSSVTLGFSIYMASEAVQEFREGMVPVPSFVLLTLLLLFLGTAGIANAMRFKRKRPNSHES